MIKNISSKAWRFSSQSYNRFIEIWRFCSKSKYWLWLYFL